ncbi:MAG: RNA polymerase sigma factor [Gemmatimonadales bacterium]|nr:RNA polymerase sigma factor [Gemmatimonadales bacterium]MBP6572145.1 RNA polymerase sigma factor [Gemmatimonadales bacterium]MBP7619416.1 RNA polymerase sigma factor [Gemmatimonadales bacterium]MBP9897743.1 RNA polymerase sigma factor [Gemmatimonadales bacterium]
MTLSTPLAGSPALDIEVSLAKAAAGGDEGAFERLYRRHVAKIHTLVRRMAGDDLADDLTQDVFIRAWQKLPTFRAESAFSTWLHRLAVNVVLSRHRSGQSERKWIQDDELALGQAAGHSPHPAVAMDLESAIGRLPDGSRQVFILHDVEGWTHEEIADRLGLVVGTSKSQLSRARAALRRMLDGH